MAVAGAVALGLMQFGVPVASAAPQASSIGAAATTGVVVADVGSAQVTAGMLGQRVEAAASLADSSYDLSFVITRSLSMSQADFFSLVRRNFVRVFPIPGATALTLGASMNLRPLKPALFNVRVTTLVANGWTFATRPGHPDFPNGYIAFRFVRIGTTMYLKVHAFVPALSAGGTCLLNLVCREVYMNQASSTWSKFAVNLTRAWNESWQVV